MRILNILLALSVALWSGLAIFTYNETTADLEIRCKYGLCDDRDMATLARYRAFQTGVAQDPRLIRNLLLKSPASPELWCDFAEALREGDRRDEAALAFDHALALAPNSPPILMRAASAHLVDNRPDAALPLFRRIFEKTPDYPGDNVFGLCRRFGVAPAAMLAAAIPPDQPKVAAGFLRFLVRAAKPDDASLAWRWIVGHSLDTPALSAEYATYLVNEKLPEPAFAVWAAKRAFAPGNLIYNPGFELAPFEPGPFDWRVDAAPGAVTVAVDPSERHSGAQSLRIQFTGLQNVAFQHVSQQTVVNAGTYSFAAWVKTTGLSTDQGLRLAIQDPAAGTLLWTSEPAISGAQPWTRISQTVTVPPGSALVRVLLLRSASTKIDSKIKGAVWLDDLELRPFRP